MYRKRHVILFIFLTFLIASAAAHIAQEQKGVLTPDNANEARLNRLQPPEQMENQMNAAGYRLERIETFLEANRMYIYVFRIDTK